MTEILECEFSIVLQSNREYLELFSSLLDSSQNYYATYKSNAELR